MKNPDYVKCVALDVGQHGEGYGQSWCGRTIYHYTEEPLAEFLKHPERGGEVFVDFDQDARPVYVRRMHASEFCFVDATHALLAARKGDALMICPACAKAMREAMARGTYLP